MSSKKRDQRRYNPVKKVSKLSPKYITFQQVTAGSERHPRKRKKYTFKEEPVQNSFHCTCDGLEQRTDWKIRLEAKIEGLNYGRVCILGLSSIGKGKPLEGL